MDSMPVKGVRGHGFHGTHIFGQIAKSGEEFGESL